MSAVGVYIANIYLNVYKVECDLQFAMSVVALDFNLDMFFYIILSVSILIYLYFYMHVGI